MEDEEPAEDDASTHVPRRRTAGRVLRGVFALAFVAVTVWNIVGVVGEDTPARPAREADEAGQAWDEKGVTIAAVGDIGSAPAGEATLAAMGQSDPDFHLVLGDLSYAGPGSADAWCRLVRSKVGPIAPVQIVAGNHEEDIGEDDRIARFSACLPDRLGSVGDYGRQYYFDLGQLARVIMTSPDLTIEGTHYYYGDGSENERWLVDAIDGARAAGIRWVVVGMHKNCISVGEYYCNVYQGLFSLLIQKRVDLVLHGHEHTYQRSKQLAAPAAGCEVVFVDAFDRDCVVDDGSDGEYRKGAGTVFVVSGAGGGLLYNVRPDDPEADYFVKTMGANKDARHGFLSVEVTRSKLSAKFVGSSDGDFADEFRIDG